LDGKSRELAQLASLAAVPTPIQAFSHGLQEFRTFQKKGANSLCADSPLRPEGGIQTEPLSMKFNG
jgi:hypothetical protein